MKILQNIGISRRLDLLVTGTLLVLGLVSLAMVFQARTNLMEQKEIKTQHVVETAYGVIEHFGTLAQEGKLSVAEAQEIAKTTISSMRYDEVEYFFINDLHPYMVMHPIKPELDGQDLTELADPAGSLVFVMAAEAAKSGGGFVKYFWPKPGFEEPVAKTTYAMQYEPWGWVIGSGVYTDDVEAAFWAYGRVVLLVIAGVMVGIWFAARMIARGIRRPVANAVELARSIAQGKLDNDLDVGRGDEVGQLMSALSDMQDELRERSEKDQLMIAESTRLKRALDNVDACVMVADANHEVIYINDAL
ncbi:MAG: cache domain-containing protein, partial [Pseudomonadota bacterium]